MFHYNTNIQLKKVIIEDVFKNITPSTKMLVFGLGYDSKMWYEGTNHNTYFVENIKKFIDLNKNDIPQSHIIEFDYKTTCEKSQLMTQEEINSFEMPSSLLSLGPFDIIIIDGPEGYDLKKPGRILPAYWSTLLSKSGSIIYFDDTDRPLEIYCLAKYYSGKEKIVIPEGGYCTKIFI